MSTSNEAMTNTTSMVEDTWQKVYEELMEYVEVDSKGRVNIKSISKNEFYKLEEKLKVMFIYNILGAELIDLGYKWVKIFLDTVEELKKISGIHYVMFSRELRSFIEDVEAHLKKKIFIYTHDLLRGRLSIEEYQRKAGAAIRTSFRTNLRTIYQDWVLLNILIELIERGGVIVYPENKYISLERMGKQKIGVIPPNTITYNPGRGYLSFFLEAPRPIGWEDTNDLTRTWKLYTALRPDIMVYGGRVLNILNLGSNPPIKRPNIIIECKELEDWYLRVRDIRGPLAQPLTAEEWRNKWIEGLWTGLADILGVEREKLSETIKERKSVRLKEYHIIALYKSLYKPDKMILISRTKLPNNIRKELEEDHNIVVYDGVGFNPNNLRDVVNTILKYAREDEELILKLRGKSRELLLKAYAYASSKGFKGSLSEFLEFIAKSYLEGKINDN